MQHARLLKLLVNVYQCWVKKIYLDHGRCFNKTFVGSITRFHRTTKQAAWGNAVFKRASFRYCVVQWSAL